MSEKTMLVVDDDSGFHLMMQKLLESAGHRRTAPCAGISELLTEGWCRSGRSRTARRIWVTARVD